MNRWLWQSATRVIYLFLLVGLSVGSAIGAFYGMAFLMNRSTSVHVSPGFAVVKFPISPLRQGVLIRGESLPDTIEVRDVTSWNDAFAIKISADEELSGVREYRKCEWELIFTEFRFITICTTKRGPLPSELREAIQRGRQLLAIVR